jgi:hypothetical protein
MSRHRLTTIVALSVLAACCAWVPAAGASSTLLSGYGGPGQGNQAILGSTLIGGGGSSGGSGGSATGQGTPAPPASIEAATSSSAAAKGAAGGSGSHPRNTNTTSGKTSGHGSPAASPAGAETIAPIRDVHSVSAPALGLGGKDIALIVLAFAVLALTAFVTVLLTRRDGPPGGGRGAIGSD